MLETDEGQQAAYNYAPGCSCDDTSGEELGLAVLPRHTKVLVTGNNRTKSVLLGLHGVVKKAVGLGGWHWLVLVIKPLFKNWWGVLDMMTANFFADFVADVLI
jgi:histone deacetylase complex subunit SAP30